jgi:hypothetical protein
MDAVARNEPCPCGSGRKYKHCCMNKSRVVETARRNARLIGLGVGLAVVAVVLMAVGRARIGAAIVLGAVMIALVLIAGGGPARPGGTGRGEGSAIDFGRKS